MKWSILLIALFAFVSCKKEQDAVKIDTTYMANVKQDLKISLEPEVLSQLDFSKWQLNKYYGDSLRLLRIGFDSKPISNEFILLQTNKLGTIEKGKIISITRTDSEADIRKQPAIFNGEIVIKSLHNAIETQSQIKKGKIESFRNKSHQLATMSTQSPYSHPDYYNSDYLPEVIVVGYRNRDNAGGFSFSQFYNFIGMMDSGGGSDYSGGDGSGYGSGSSQWYSYGGGGGGGTGGSGGGSPTPNPIPSPDEMLWVDFEPDAETPIDLGAYLKCFDNIADEGAICSIRILTDIPVDDDPSAFFDWKTGSPGHTFLEFSKSKDGQNIKQVIGFYPSSPWKVLLSTDAIDGIFANNGGHEYNAALNMPVSSTTFRNTVNYLKMLGGRAYDIDEYNCTDLALDVFNSARNTPLVIPKYEIVGGSAPGKTNTPQGLFNKLKEMNDKGAEPGQISVSTGNNFAGGSNGPCN